MIDYTQQLEQDVILNYFESKEHGILLDIGANDGETFSNSRALILNGWTGALVEPDPQPLYKLEKLYYHNPSIQIIDNAIDNYNEKITMHCSGTHLNMGDMGLLSTINEKEKERWHSETFTEVEVDVIDFKTLLDITKFTKIDFISISKSCFFSRYRSNTNTLINTEAARFDDTFFQTPSFITGMLEI